MVSPIGIGKEAFWSSLISGRSGIGLVTHFDASSYPCNYAGEVYDFQATDFISPKSARRLSRSSQFAVVAAQKAFEDAQLDPRKEDPYEIGICCGSSIGPMDIYEKFGATFYERGLKRVSPFFEGMMNHNAMVGALAEIFDSGFQCHSLNCVFCGKHGRSSCLSGHLLRNGQGHDRGWGGYSNLSLNLWYLCGLPGHVAQ
jgi:3-oxoacyl-(acyl-carrier-protein) synthase